LEVVFLLLFFFELVIWLGPCSLPPEGRATFWRRDSPFKTGPYTTDLHNLWTKLQFVHEPTP
jgi:hypothetical protein